MTILECSSEQELLSAWPVMRQLRDHLDEAGFLSGVARMRERGYRLLAVEEGGRVVACAGIEETYNLYYGHHIWVYDLVTDGDVRSRGHGEKLLAHVEDLAREAGCERVALSSGLQRVDAHRFYEERMGYTRHGYSYFKMV